MPDVSPQEYVLAEIQRLIGVAEMNGLSATARALHHAQAIASWDEGADEDVDELTTEEIEEMLANVIEIHRPSGQPDT